MYVKGESATLRPSWGITPLVGGSEQVRVMQPYSLGSRGRHRKSYPGVTGEGV
jgi:hypothetical protein